MACPRLGLVGTATGQSRPRTFLSYCGWQTHGCLSLGTYRHLQKLPGYHPPPQNPLALQKGEQKSRAYYEAQRRQDRRCLWCANRSSINEREYGRAKRVRQTDWWWYDVKIRHDLSVLWHNHNYGRSS